MSIATTKYVGCSGAPTSMFTTFFFNNGFIQNIIFGILEP